MRVTVLDTADTDVDLRDKALAFMDIKPINKHNDYTGKITRRGRRAGRAALDRQGSRSGKPNSDERSAKCKEAGRATSWQRAQ